MRTLKEKRVVITGAASGIGKALVRKFLEHGFRVWAVDNNDAALLKLASDFEADASVLKAVNASVTDRAALSAVRDEVVGQSGGIDVWINNAGIAGRGNFLDQTQEQFEEVLSVNLMGTIYGTRLALTQMESQGSGVIVNVGAVVGHIAVPHLSSYVASKHGIVGFTRSLRHELKRRESPVRVVLVSPGFVDTDILGRGQPLGFPKHLNWMLAKSESVATSIFSGLQKERPEIYPTLNGHLLMYLHRMFPQFVARKFSEKMSRDARGR